VADNLIILEISSEGHAHSMIMDGTLSMLDIVWLVGFGTAHVDVDADGTRRTLVLILLSTASPFLVRFVLGTFDLIRGRRIFMMLILIFFKGP